VILSGIELIDAGMDMAWMRLIHYQGGVRLRHFLYSVREKGTERLVSHDKCARVERRDDRPCTTTHDMRHLPFANSASVGWIDLLSIPACRPPESIWAYHPLVIF